MTETESLIVRMKQGDSSAKDILVNLHTGLVWSVVKRFQNRGVETDDLFQLGCLGLLKAFDGFDPAYGTQFSTYAVPKISGEIRRFLRDDGAIKVSRCVKENAYAIYTAREILRKELDREPTISELSLRTDLSAEEIAAAEIATAIPESIQKETGEDGFSLENILTDTLSEERIVEQLSVRQAVGSLPERERQIILLRYFHGLTQQKTAQILKISQVQVSRIEKKAITLLRQTMES